MENSLIGAIAAFALSTGPAAASERSAAADDAADSSGEGTVRAAIARHILIAAGYGDAGELRAVGSKLQARVRRRGEDFVLIVDPERGTIVRRDLA